MRILFIVTGNGARSNFVNGYTMRYGGAGLSGTDTSTILIAEYLAANGFEVVIACEKPSDDLIRRHNEKGNHFQAGDKVNGVVYTWLDLENIENKVFHIAVTSLWYDGYENFPAIITRGLIYWAHLAWIYYAKNMADFVKDRSYLKFGFINISKWSEGHHKENLEYFIRELGNINDVILPNAMCVDIMEEVDKLDIQMERKKVIFPAQWNRGGPTAYRAVEDLGWNEMKSFDYVNIDAGVDKLTLFKELASSEYFFFPQMGTNQWVLKDVHSCAMAEAIGMGVVVLSYPLGSHEEYYDGYYAPLNFPAGIDMEKMMRERATHEPLLDDTQPIINAASYLEQAPHLKEYYREVGKKYIRERFNIEKIGPMWVDYLNKF
jgi:hypothetical protein